MAHAARLPWATALTTSLPPLTQSPPLHTFAWQEKEQPVWQVEKLGARRLVLSRRAIRTIDMPAVRRFVKHYITPRRDELKISIALELLEDLLDVERFGLERLNLGMWLPGGPMIAPRDDPTRS